MSLIAPVAFTCALLLPALSYGAAPLSAAELQEYCRAFKAEPQSEGGRLCVNYVRGFVDGLIAAESAVTPAKPKSESWTERAARTRLGSRYQPSVVDCLDDPLALQELIARVLQRLPSDGAEENASAREWVAQVLRERSPCDDDHRR